MRKRTLVQGELPVATKEAAIGYLKFHCVLPTLGLERIYKKV